MVVINERSTPNRRLAISMTGVMQFVVQLAHEMICGLPSARFAPCTTVGTVSSWLGADRMTNDAPARTCLVKSSAWVNFPVHSETRSTPSSAQGSSSGSRSVKVGIRVPSMISAPPMRITATGSSPNTPIATAAHTSSGAAVMMSNQASQISSTPVATALRMSRCLRCQPRIAVVTIRTTNPTSKPTHVADQLRAT